jgi:hypothetical protein
MEEKITEISGCGECPFRTEETKCSKNDAIEIDLELMDDDLPAICPLRNGKSHRVSEEEVVRLAAWILRASVSNLDD